MEGGYSQENINILQIQSELERLLKDLNERPELINKCLSLLEQLYNTPVTIQMLISTRIGFYIGGLLKHPSRSISNKASEIVFHWKNKLQPPQTQPTIQNSHHQFAFTETHAIHGPHNTNIHQFNNQNNHLLIQTENNFKPILSHPTMSSVSKDNIQYKTPYKDTHHNISSHNSSTYYSSSHTTPPYNSPSHTNPLRNNPSKSISEHNNGYTLEMKEREENCAQKNSLDILNDCKNNEFKKSLGNEGEEGVSMETIDEYVEDSTLKARFLSTDSVSEVGTFEISNINSKRGLEVCHAEVDEKSILNRSEEGHNEVNTYINRPHLIIKKSNIDEMDNYKTIHTNNNLHTPIDVNTQSHTQPITQPHTQPITQPHTQPITQPHTQHQTEGDTEGHIKKSLINFEYLSDTENGGPHREGHIKTYTNKRMYDNFCIGNYMKDSNNRNFYERRENGDMETEMEVNKKTGVDTEVREVEAKSVKRGYRISNTYNGLYRDESVRNKALDMLYKGFIEGIDEEILGVFNEEEVSNLIYNIEACVHTAKRAEGLRNYTQQILAIKYNLSDKTNPDLNIHIYNKHITPQQLAQMTSFDMASKHLKHIRNIQHKQSIEACQSDWHKRHIHSNYVLYICPICDSYQTQFTHIHTKDYEDSLTTFLTCNQCNHSWTL